MEPTKENTLNLIIKQIYFDLIVSGEKTEEYREIKDTTFSKYLDYDKNEGFLLLEELVHGEIDDLDIYSYNEGEYPFVPRNYDFIKFAVGYAKDRDQALVEVKDISFEIMKDSSGREIRFNWAEEDETQEDQGDDDQSANTTIIPDEKGMYALWQIVYHLGKVMREEIGVRS